MQVHELIGMGYERMDFSLHQSSKEPHITGELVRAIETVLEDERSPDWVIWYSVHDDPPVNKKGRYGKNRQRVDIKIVRHLKGKRPKMQFEAKRLCNGSSVSKYLGSEGLGCFLAGEYAHEQQEAGMLGYVQINSERTWANKIKSSLEENPQDYNLRKNDRWKKTSIASKLNFTYRTCHDRVKANGYIGISHVFLRFHN